VRRDSYGVPFLSGPDPVGLARLQGRVTAEDRAWQIEVDRRRSLGSSAAWLGRDASSLDVLTRRMLLDDTARRCFDALDDEHRAWVAAYADGVNDALPEAGRRSHEMRLLGVEPGEWAAWSPIGVLLVQHAFFGSWPTKLWRERVVSRLGRDALLWFGTEGADASSGSNAWVVRGSATASGAPLLAADPHRLLEVPGVYQQVGLSCPEFDVVGLAFPGVPGIPHFGRTEHVAWAVTNALADDRDLFRERLRRSSDGYQALGADGWEPVTWRREEVEVRGGETIAVDVLETARGPVVVDDADGAVSLRTPVRVLGDCGLGASLPMLRARDAAGFADAVSRWVEPVNRLLVADTAGAVLEVHAGRVPERDLAAAVVPLPAWRREHEWRGWHDLGARRAAGPAVVHANHRLDAPVLATDYVPSHRAERIADLLDGVPRVTAEQMNRWQTDTVARGALRLVGLLDGVDVRQSAVRRLADRLRRWDGDMRADSTTAAVFARWRHRLVDEIQALPALAPLADDLCPEVPDLLAPWVSTRARIGLALEHLMLDRPSPVTSPADVAVEALTRVADEMSEDPSLERRTWGDTHRLFPLHALPGSSDALLRAAGDQLDLAVGGDSETVLATGSSPGVSDRALRVPVARVVWDLADRSGCRWVVPTGALGDPTSPHHLDQLSVWLAGELVPAVHPDRHRPEERP
jgi:penicillin amidase